MTCGPYHTVRNAYGQYEDCNELVTEISGPGAGGRIRYARLLLSLLWREDISQKQFTRLVAVHAKRLKLRDELAPNSASRWEGAVNPPPDDILEAIEALTGVDRAWLRYGSPRGPAPMLYEETGGELGTRDEEVERLLRSIDEEGARGGKGKKEAKPWKRVQKLPLGDVRGNQTGKGRKRA